MACLRLLAFALIASAVSGDDRVPLPSCSVVVVGGGVAGLHIATLAKQAAPRHDVCLLEREAKTGGRLRDVTFDAAPKTAADLGAWRIGNFEQFWLDYAKEKGIEIDPWDLNVSYHARGIVASNWHGLLDAFPSLNAEYIKSFDSVEAWVAAEIKRRAEIDPAIYGSHTQYLSAVLSSEGMYFYAIYRQTPSGFTTLLETTATYKARIATTTGVSSGGFSKGFSRPRFGGMQSLSDALRVDAEKAGVVFITGEEVVDISYGTGVNASAVVRSRSGLVLNAEQLLIAVPPQPLSRIGGDLVRDILKQRIFQSFISGITFKSAAVYSEPWWEACGVKTLDRFIQDPDSNCLGSTVAYAAREENATAHVLQTSYVHGRCAEMWAHLVGVHSRDEIGRIITTELQRAFESCPGGPVAVPEPIDFDFACWACDGIGWGVSHNALVNPATGKEYTQIDVQEWAKRPLASLRDGAVRLVGADYSPDTGFSQGALASAKCAAYFSWGVPVGNVTYWKDSHYCDLSSPPRQGSFPGDVVLV